MYGMIFAELKKYVDTKLSGRAWADLLQHTGNGTKIYMNFHNYPDAELGALVNAAAAHTGIAVADILEDFGEFIASDLLAMYQSVIPSEWRTLDVVEHTEEVIHRVVRLRNPGAHPPHLQSRRLSPQAVEIRYNSPRRLCALAKGICRGIARHHNEAVQIDEPQCMHAGADACLLVVQLADAGRRP